MKRDLPTQLIDELKNRDKKHRRFFKSKKFKNLLELIRLEERIDCDSLDVEETKVERLTSEDFGRVCDAVFYNLGERTIRDESPFELYHIDYNDVRFYLMIGQGSAYFTQKLV